jgi:2-polyprenyl-3-methyl-5-hydroxy-6-metoxy-1,4-benzoquinol methylase
VRRGACASPHPSTEPEYEEWVEFAHDMAPMMAPAARDLAQVLGPIEGHVLDVAAGHGVFGITLAQANPGAFVTALDWPKVVEVAHGNAQKAEVEDRYSTIAGDAFQAPLGGPYDVILLTNLLHHFDSATCVTLLERMRNALKPGGRVATLEFIPNADRVSPYIPALFPMIMLASTPAGDAFTEAEYRAMFDEAGFGHSEFHALAHSPEQLIVSRV